MNDTHKIVEEKYLDMMRQKSPEERFLMACSMYMSTKELVKASIQKNGKLPANELRQELFLRYYGHEYDEIQKRKILKHLDKVRD